MNSKKKGFFTTIPGKFKNDSIPYYTKEIFTEKKKVTMDRWMFMLTIGGFIVSTGALLVSIFSAADTRRSVKLAEIAIHKSDTAGMKQDTINRVTLGLMVDQNTALRTTVSSLIGIDSNIKVQSALQNENIKQAKSFVTSTRMIANYQRQQLNDILRKNAEVPIIDIFVTEQTNYYKYYPNYTVADTIPDMNKEPDYNKPIFMNGYTLPRRPSQGTPPIKSTTSLHFTIWLRNSGNMEADNLHMSAMLAENYTNPELNGSILQFECNDPGVQINGFKPPSLLESIPPFAIYPKYRPYHFNIVMQNRRFFELDVSVWAHKLKAKTRRIKIGCSN